MRFFSNENKDDGTDPKDVDVKERGDHHSDGTDPSDTVTLPQQRGNSPWSSTPDTDRTHDSDATDTNSADTDPTGTHRRDDEPLIEDPTPPDHAAADTSPDATPRDDATGTGWAGPTSTGETTDGKGATLEDDGKGATLQDDGDFDDPKVVDGKGATLDDDATTDGKGATLKDDGGFDDPKVVETTDTAVIVAEPVAAKAAVEDAPVSLDGDTGTPAGGTPAGEAKPGEVPAPEVTTIFGADDAKAFQDRWRDVQLRFVDSPKEATAEAATLVDDAVEKLTASLRGQKDSFRGDSTEDTEKLRVELRGYREIFNRIIGL